MTSLEAPVRVRSLPCGLQQFPFINTVAVCLYNRSLCAHHKRAQ
jgi:hypothetical protein